jgi:hypothetical protein
VWFRGLTRGFTPLLRASRIRKLSSLLLSVTTLNRIAPAHPNLCPHFHYHSLLFTSHLTLEITSLSHLPLLTSLSSPLLLSPRLSLSHLPLLASLSSPLLLSPRLSFSLLSSPSLSSLSSLSSRPYTGGGLSVNYSSDDVTPTFREYSEALSGACPHVFSPLSDGSAQRLTIMTGQHTGCAVMPQIISHAHTR